MPRSLISCLIGIVLFVVMVESAAAQQCWYQHCRVDQCWHDASYGQLCRDYCTFSCHGDTTLYAEFTEPYQASTASGSGRNDAGMVLFVLIIIGIIAACSSSVSTSDGTSTTSEVAEIDSLSDRADTLSKEIDDAISKIMAEARRDDPEA